MDKPNSYNRQTINKTVNSDLCISCGVCKGTCPQDCISMEFCDGQFFPTIDQNNCINCGQCIEVCPGIKVNFEELYKFDDKSFPSNIYVGNVLDAYIAYSKEDEIRKIATSGGIVTSLIVELIRKNIYQIAFVVDFDNFKGEEVKSKPVNNIKQIQKAAKSKYLPVSVEEVINYVSQNPNNKIIVVGTSCHIHGIKKYLKEEGLNDNYILFLGLFCDKTLNLNIFKYYRDKFSPKGKGIKKFEYRSKKDSCWPGDTRVVFDSGKECIIDRDVRIELKDFFQLHRCVYCIDKLNQFADISFGDCYIEGEETKLGKSNLIVRTEKGKEVLNGCKDLFHLRKVDIDDIYVSQKIDKRKKNLEFAKVISEEHNLYPDLIKNNEKIDEDLKKELEHIRNTINYGKKYLNNPNKVHRRILLNKIKAKVKKFLINSLELLGIKEIIKKIIN